MKTGVEEPTTDILSLVYRWLESDESNDWLIILNNADDIDAFFPFHAARASSTRGRMPPTTVLSTYLSRNARGAMLIASRSRDAAFRLTGKQERVIKVDIMNVSEAKVLLDKKLPYDTSVEEDWNALVQALEYLPLAIMQAAAYITMKARRVTVSTYLTYFRQSEATPSSLLSRDWGDLRRDHDLPNAVGMIMWPISFDQIKSQDPPAAQLLSRMSVLDRQGVPAFFFYHDDEDKLASDDAVGTLAGFSFVAAEKDENTYVMHRLVRLSMKTCLEAHGEMARTKGDTLRTLASKYPDGSHAN